MSEDYWDGATWVYHSIVTNQASAGDGSISWTVIPGAGNEMVVLYGRIVNLDITGRLVTLDIETDIGGETLGRLITITPNAASAVGFPVMNVQAAAGSGSAPARYILSGTTRLVATVVNVTNGQDAEFGIVCRIRGGVPTVTEAGVGSFAITELTEQVF